MKDEEYKLIPMSEITDEARRIAVAWMECEDKDWIGQKHKLASDIMNYATKYSSELLRQRDELREALERIANPIAYMERNLKEGERLNGMMAIQIGGNPEYLKAIAEAAIKNTDG